MFNGRHFLFSSLLLAYGFLVTLPASLIAEDDPAQLLPESTIFYAEISEPAKIIDGLLEHPLTKRLQQEPAYQKLMEDPELAELPTILKYVESQFGMDWDDALKAITAGGITIAIDPKTDGVALFIKAKDKKSLDKIVQTMLELAKEEAKKNERDAPYDTDEYRGITTYGVQEGGFATHENWFIFVNNENIGRVILDAILDGNHTNSFANNKQFQLARSNKKKTDAAWLYVDLKTIREAGTAKKFFSGKAKEPLGEILLGGILEVLKETPYLTATLETTKEEARVQVSIPFQKSWVSESRTHYFGPRVAGQANVIPDVPNLLFATSTYRNFSKMWLYADDLFNERIVDKFSEADSTLTTLFSGKDFGKDILGALSAEVLFVIAGQEFVEENPVPAIKLPAFAVKAEMKDSKTTSREFRRIFNSLVGFYNVVGSMDGEQQLELDFEKNEHGQLISATFVPVVGEEKKQNAKINFNFSPTIVFSGNNVIVSSTTKLARDLTSAKKMEPKESKKTINTIANLSAPILKKVLEDNRSHLISKNMLEEGHSQKEAEKEVGLLLKLLGYFQSVSLSLETSEKMLDLNITLEVVK